MIYEKYRHGITGVRYLQLRFRANNWDVPIPMHEYSQNEELHRDSQNEYPPLSRQNDVDLQTLWYS